MIFSSIMQNDRLKLPLLYLVRKNLARWGKHAWQTNTEYYSVRLSL
jgi:hypothetical protein